MEMAIASRLDDEAPRGLLSRLADFYTKPHLYNRYFDRAQLMPDEEFGKRVRRILLRSAAMYFNKVLDRVSSIDSPKDRHKEIMRFGHDLDYATPHPVRLCALFHTSEPSHYYMLGSLLHCGNATQMGLGYSGVNYASMVMDKTFERTRHDLDGFGIIPREILRKLSLFLSFHPQAFEVNTQVVTLDLTMERKVPEDRNPLAPAAPRDPLGSLDPPTYAFGFIMDMPKRYLLPARATIVECMHAALGFELGKTVGYEVFAYDIDLDLLRVLVENEHLNLHAE